MKRREFITVLSGAAAWPIAARGQTKQMRRIGVLMGVADDREGQARVTTLKQGLQELGWTDGRNIQIETRFTGADADMSSSSRSSSGPTPGGKHSAAPV
jgi:putative ABC transport system substrate-binding protein